MGLVRRSLIVLVAIVTALAGAFDGCLLDCHAQSPVLDVQATAHSHCHPAAAQQAGARWQADPTCHHDHASAAAESAARNRLDSRVLGVVVSPATQLDRSVVSTVPDMRSTADRSGPMVALIPLRV
jgi:hypothetical protein